jgi:hypothetical protein
LVNHSDLSAAKVFLFQQTGLENQFEVGGVHIRIGQYNPINEAAL